MSNKNIITSEHSNTFFEYMKYIEQLEEQSPQESTFEIDDILSILDKDKTDEYVSSRSEYLNFPSRNQQPLLQQQELDNLGLFKKFTYDTNLIMQTNFISHHDEKDVFKFFHTPDDYDVDQLEHTNNETKAYADMLSTLIKSNTSRITNISNNTKVNSNSDSLTGFNEFAEIILPIETIDSTAVKQMFSAKHIPSPTLSPTSIYSNNRNELSFETDSDSYPNAKFVPKNSSVSISFPSVSSLASPNVKEKYNSPEIKISTKILSTNFQKLKYSCKVCNKKFKRPSSLNTHMNIHTGHKPYSCFVESCNKSFNAKSNMLRHYKLHFRLSNGAYLLPNGEMTTKKPTSKQLSPLIADH